jgi:hypothetical protein
LENSPYAWNGSTQWVIIGNVRFIYNTKWQAYGVKFFRFDTQDMWSFFSSGAVAFEQNPVNSYGEDCTNLIEIWFVNNMLVQVSHNNIVPLWAFDAYHKKYNLDTIFNKLHLWQRYDYTQSISDTSWVAKLTGIMRFIYSKLDLFSIANISNVTTLDSMVEITTK